VKNDTYACINQAVSASCSSVQQFAAGEAEGQQKTVHSRVYSVTYCWWLWGGKRTCSWL